MSLTPSTNRRNNRFASLDEDSKENERLAVLGKENKKGGKKKGGKRALSGTPKEKNRDASRSADRVVRVGGGFRRQNAEDDDEEEDFVAPTNRNPVIMQTEEPTLTGVDLMPDETFENQMAELNREQILRDQQADEIIQPQEILFEPVNQRVVILFLIIFKKYSR